MRRTTLLKQKIVTFLKHGIVTQDHEPFYKSPGENFAVMIKISFRVEQNGFHVAELDAELLCQPFLGGAIW